MILTPKEIAPRIQLSAVNDSQKKLNLLTLQQTITLEINRDELTGEMRQIRETNLEPWLEEPGWCKKQES